MISGKLPVAGSKRSSVRFSSELTADFGIQWGWLTSLFLIALFIRLAALAVIPPPHLDDGAVVHMNGAQLLLNGAGFADRSFPVIIAPLYTVFIAVSSLLSDNQQLTIKIAQALIDAITAALIYLIAFEVFGKKTALVSASIWAVYPFSIYPTVYIGSETLFTCLLSAFVLLTVHGIRSSSWKIYALSGMMLGLATLTRGTTQFVPILLPAFVFVTFGMKRDTLKGYLAFIFSFIVMLMPWTLRNSLVLQQFIPVATSGGMVLLWGSSEEFFTIDQRIEKMPAYFELMQAKGIQSPDPGRFLTMAAIERYKMRLHDDPGSVLPFLLKKFARLWYATESGRKQGIILTVNAPMYIFSVGGLVFSWLQRRKLASVPVFVIAYFAIVHVVTLPLFRYMIPVMPLVVMFAGFAFVTILNYRAGMGVHETLETVQS